MQRLMTKKLNQVLALVLTIAALMTGARSVGREWLEHQRQYQR